jgi:hypothetical protein
MKPCKSSHSVNSKILTDIPQSIELQQLLVIAKLNESSKGDRGETARVLRKLAEAYQLRGLKGDADKATEFRNNAEAMRKEIQGSRFSSLEDNDLSYAMMSFHAFW